MSIAVLALTTLLHGALASKSEESDLAAARTVFQRNVAAIRERDRDAYVACYLESERLVRTGFDGFELGWQGLAEGAPATGSDDWPAVLLARDLQLTWLRPGLVYGTYRYRVSYDGSGWNEGLSERLFALTDAGWRIAVTTAFDSAPGTPAPPLALVGAMVLDGTGGAPVPDAVVVLRGGLVESFGPRSEVAVPEGIDVVDLSGKFLTPGLVDTHVHYSQTGWVDGRPDAADVRDRYPYEVAMAENEAHPERFDRAFLASGITAVFDVGGYPWTRRLRARNEDSSDAPHVAAAGPLLSTFDPGLNLVDRAQMVFPKSEADARAMVRSHVAAGSDAIKFWYVVRDEGDVERYAPLVRAAADEARARGVPFIVHATTLESARVAVEAGTHLLVHSVEDALVDEAFVAACLAQGTFLCPTLTVFDGYAGVYLAEVPDAVRAGLELVHPSVRARVLETERLPEPSNRTTLAQRLAQRGDERRRIMFANLVTLHEAGVPIVMGTDAGNPLTLHGPSVFSELEAMQAAGLSPSEVLVASTSRAAAAMGRGDDFGLIAPGLAADLLVLDRDPSADIENVRSITHVVRRGTLHTRAHLTSYGE
jgi:imidazolonepropionase-like amidohydrolase